VTWASLLELLRDKRVLIDWRYVESLGPVLGEKERLELLKRMFPLLPIPGDQVQYPLRTGAFLWPLDKRTMKGLCLGRTN
jgi:hypothetical protein